MKVVSITDEYKYITKGKIYDVLRQEITSSSALYQIKNDNYQITRYSKECFILLSEYRNHKIDELLLK